MRTWSLTPLDQLSQFRKAPQDEIDIESPIALAAKSRDQRLRPIRSDCSHNHQWFFFSYSSFLMKKYFLMLTAEMPPIFQFTSINIVQGQNHVFLLILSSSQSFLTCGCLGTRRNGWDTDVLWEELLAENYKLLVAQAFSQAFVFIIIATLIGIITRFI